MPTFVHGKNLRVFIDQYDFSVYFTDLTATSTVEVAETSGFGTDAKTYIPGIKDGSVSLSGLFDGTETGTNTYFNSVLGTATKEKVIVAPGGHSNGANAIILQSDNTSYEVSGTIGDVVQTSAEFQSDEGVEHGKILSSGSAAATGNGTAVDNTAATTNGGVGFLSIPGNTRNGNVSVKIQQSADNSTFTDLITFTTASAATSVSQRVVVTGTVARYLRVNYTVAGSTGSATPVVAFARRN
jgi:hypothetical protein